MEIFVCVCVIEHIHFITRLSIVYHNRTIYRQTYAKIYRKQNEFVTFQNRIFSDFIIIIIINAQNLSQSKKKRKPSAHLYDE